jgi:predicted transcriptional regulator
MPRRKSKTLTQVELEFMQAIWEHGEVTTEDVLAHLAARGRRLADGSVRKILSILVAKGYVVRRPDGRAFRYKAAVAEGRANRSMLLDLVERAFAGSPALMVASLLDNTRMSKKDLAAIKRLIAEKEQGQ